MNKIFSLFKINLFFYLLKFVQKVNNLAMKQKLEELHKTKSKTKNKQT